MLVLVVLFALGKAFWLDFPFRLVLEDQLSHSSREPVFGGLRSGKTQTGLLRYTSWLES